MIASASAHHLQETLTSTNESWIGKNPSSHQENFHEQHDIVLWLSYANSLQASPNQQANIT